MTFEFDAGAPSFTPRDPEAVAPHGMAQQVMDRVLDSLPEDATQAQIDGAAVLYVLGLIRECRIMPTLRRRIRQLWPIIAPLADREPQQFDAIVMEVAEMATCTPEIPRRHGAQSVASTASRLTSATSEGRKHVQD